MKKSIIPLVFMLLLCAGGYCCRAEGTQITAINDVIGREGVPITSAMPVETSAFATVAAESRASIKTLFSESFDSASASVQNLSQPDWVGNVEPKWTVANASDMTHPDASPFSGTKCVRFNSYSTANQNYAVLTCPNLTSQSTGTIYISFTMYHDTAYPDRYDCIVPVATNVDGDIMVQWEPLSRNPALPRVGWHKYDLYLTGLTYGEIFGFNLLGLSYNGNDIYIDDIIISQETDDIPTTSVSLNKATLTLEQDKTEILTATVLPQNATDKRVEWLSSDALYATVSANGAVTGHTPGTVLITVRTIDTGKTATCLVTVTPPSVTSVALNKTTVIMRKNSLEQLTATLTPPNGGVTWTTSNADVASVGYSGIVYSVGEGTAIIRATAENTPSKYAECTITVINAQASVTAESVSGDAGSYVDVPIRITAGQKIKSFSLTLTYNSFLVEPISVIKNQSLLSQGQFTSVFDGFYCVDVQWSGNAVAAADPVFTIRFAINESAAPNSISAISFINDQTIVNQYDMLMDVTPEPGEISVRNGTVQISIVKNDSFIAENAVYVRVTADINNFIGTPKNARILTAVYNNTGKLVHFKMSEHETLATETWRIDFNETIPWAEKNAPYEVKFFVWDSVDRLKNLALPKSVFINSTTISL